MRSKLYIPALSIDDLSSQMTSKPFCLDERGFPAAVGGQPVDSGVWASSLRSAGEGALARKQCGGSQSGARSAKALAGRALFAISGWLRLHSTAVARCRESRQQVNTNGSIVVGSRQGRRRVPWPCSGRPWYSPTPRGFCNRGSPTGFVRQPAARHDVKDDRLGQRLAWAWKARWSHAVAQGRMQGAALFQPGRGFRRVGGRRQPQPRNARHR